MQCLKIPLISEKTPAKANVTSLSVTFADVNLPVAKYLTVRPGPATDIREVRHATAVHSKVEFVTSNLGHTSYADARM